ncbi:hypothetical protein M911_06800 [Ectothiorhodospira haloalkaliphila]|uniref:Uncharacterized protein n=2 Tax=Ectothiorhodospira haloalkaliphila TaxID=421628 RepID=W8KGI1_9GAMM|nr:hypothetical protein M911_06800 [Ectothiorhodospira haloalkaliphila]
MYLLRYGAKDGAAVSIPITIHAAPVGKGSIDFFPAEGVTKNTLRHPGDCLVARVKSHQAGLVVSEYHPAQAEHAHPVNLHIDRVDTSENFGRTSPTSKEPEPVKPANVEGQPQPLPLKLLGHLEGRGDVTVTAPNWLGNPEGRARIEGFSIEWPDRPAEVDIAYTCYSSRAGQTPAIYSGGFAGSRAQASPITSLSLGLVGTEAQRYQLSGQVVFAGCPPLAIEPGKKLSGAKGTEQLVAMQVTLACKQGEVTVPRSPSPWNNPEVTQIFRAKQKPS